VAALAVLLAIAAAGVAGEAPAAAAGAPAAADSARAAAPAAAAFGTRADSSRARLAAAPERAFDAPGWVMMRSLAVPGWGQLHNGSWLKAVVVAGAEAALAAGIASDLRALDRLDAEVQTARGSADADAENAAVMAYNARLDRMVSRQWLLGGVVAYALLDAYVDAHFRNFRLEFEHDPALPGGRPPGARLFARWTF
jgi:hypothetical protein